MKRVCQDYAKTKTVPGLKQISVSFQLNDIAIAFIELQDARILADYDLAAVVTHVEAETEVARAETAFAKWLQVESDPASDHFLAELWCRGIPKR